MPNPSVLLYLLAGCAFLGLGKEPDVVVIVVTAPDTEMPPDTDTPGTTTVETATPVDTAPAVDTTPNPECGETICVKYGAAMPIIGSNIVDAAAVDPNFQADFAPLVAQGPQAIEDFKESLTNFMSDAYGCTSGAYSGPSMQAAHKGMKITQQEYDAFIALIAEELVEIGIPLADVEDCFAPPLIDPAFADTIIGQ